MVTFSFIDRSQSTVVNTTSVEVWPVQDNCNRSLIDNFQGSRIGSIHSASAIVEIAGERLYVDQFQLIPNVDD